MEGITGVSSEGRAAGGVEFESGQEGIVSGITHVGDDVPQLGTGGFGGDGDHHHGDFAVFGGDERRGNAGGAVDVSVHLEHGTACVEYSCHVGAGEGAVVTAGDDGEEGGRRWRWCCRR